MKNLIHPRLRPLVAYIAMVFLMCASPALQAVFVLAGFMGLLVYYVTPQEPAERDDGGV